MKAYLSIAASLLAANLASAALVGTGTDPWDGSATSFDAGVTELYSHLNGNSNLYLKPDSNEDRFANGGFLSQISVTGLDKLELFALGSNAAFTNFFGVRVYVGGNSYELTLTPSNATQTATRHYFASVNDILAATGGPTLEHAGVNGGTTTETALLDFFIYDPHRNVKTYASGVDNTGSAPPRPAFNFTPDLLTTPGLSAAKPLPASKPNAISFLADEGFEVWGLEDVFGPANQPGMMEPDYNDRIFAFRITAVPEPSAYGVVGALALACLIGYRRFRAARR